MGEEEKVKFDTTVVSRLISTVEVESFLKGKVAAKECCGISEMLETLLLCYHTG